MDSKTPKLCPQAKKCGGCQLQNMTYEEQLRFKQSKVRKLLSCFHTVKPMIGMKDPFHYRCKVQAAFGLTRSGMTISGVYQASTHNIVKVDQCLIEDEKADEIIVTIRNMLRPFHLSVYDERTSHGMLRHVLIRRGRATGEVMVVLVTASPMFTSKKAFVSTLLKAHPEITTVVQNINPKYTSMVLGDRETVLYGKGYIEDVLCGCRFRISAGSFYQVNPVQTEVLYRTAIDFAALSGKERVIDAYCGIGTISIVAAKNALSVVGCELNADAVRDARVNAGLNDVKNIEFVCCDAGDFMSDAASNGEKADVVFLDPPRSGSTEKFLFSLAKLSPEKIVYVSCAPDTLRRDLFILIKHGYRVTKIQPVDMFPYTVHIECCCLLEKI